MNMTTFRPIYHALSSSRHTTEVVLVLLLVAAVIEGYAMVVVALAICHALKRKFKNATIKEPRVALGAGLGQAVLK